LIKPKALEKGDTIGVLSPASKPQNENNFLNGIKYLEDSGYNTIVAKHTLNERGYLAGTDSDRLTDLHEMFADPQVKAIFCSRGGYGTPRILHQVDYDLIKNNPKIFVGYSDITALCFAILAKSGLITFSGPMVAVEMGKGIQLFSENSLWQNLTYANDLMKIKNPESEAIRVIKEGKGEGRLIAGCLSVLVGLIGSSYMPDLTGAILVVEDVQEAPYRIDRCLAQLRLTGILQKLNGLVFGQFIDCVPTDSDAVSLTYEEVLLDYVHDLNIPVISNVAYGHGPIKVTLPIGVQAQLDTSNGFLTILERPVESSREPCA